MIGIYRIVNKVNGKCYVGQSVNVEGRLSNHLKWLSSGSHGNKHLQSAYNKYGADNFITEVLEECSKSDLNAREKYWISYYDSFNSGYNLTTGGEYAGGFIHSQLTKDKISEALRKNNPMKRYEVVKKSNIDRVWSDESRDKLRKSQMDRVWITKGDRLKRVKSSDVDSYTDDGWIIGIHTVRKSRTSGEYRPGNNFKSANKGRVSITKDGVSKYVSQSDLDSYLSQGWVRGRNTGSSISFKKSKYIYLYEGNEYLGPTALSRYLQSNGYPDIDQCIVIKLSHGESTVYPELNNKITTKDNPNYSGYNKTSGEEGSSKKGRISIVKGDKAIYIDPSEYSEYESDGWIKGRRAEACLHIKNSKSGYYKYEDKVYRGLISLRDHLRLNGYPKIAKSTVLNLSLLIRMNGYDDLLGKIIRVDKEGNPVATEITDYHKGKTNGRAGKRLYHKGDKNKYIPIESIPQYESEGWIKGSH